MNGIITKVTNKAGKYKPYKIVELDNGNTFFTNDTTVTEGENITYNTKQVSGYTWSTGPITRGPTLAPTPDKLDRIAAALELIATRLLELQT